jgi:hypothetical protein
MQRLLIQIYDILCIFLLLAINNVHLAAEIVGNVKEHISGFEPHNYKDILLTLDLSKALIPKLSEDFHIQLPYNTASATINNEVCSWYNFLPASSACTKIKRIFLDEKAKTRLEIAAPYLVAEILDASNIVNEVEGKDFWKVQLKNLKTCLATRSPTQFLRCDVIMFLMFAGSNILAQQEIRWLQRHTSEEWRMNMLQESSVGDPPYHVYFDHSKYWTSTNLIHHVYSYARFENTVPNVKISSLDLIVEFGGGYGSFARVVLNGGFKGRYIIYDLHPFNIIQKYYLSALGFTIRAIDEWNAYDNGVWLVHDLDTLKQLHLYERFAVNELTMFVAMFSISEVTDSLKDSFMALGPGTFHNYFFYFQPKWQTLSNVGWFTNFIFNKRADLRWTVFEDYGHHVGINEENGESKSLNKLAIGTFENRGAFRAQLQNVPEKLVKVVQGIKTQGAAGFESFKIDGITYLSVANFWDGKSKDMGANSVIYRVTPLSNRVSGKNDASTYMLNFDIVQKFFTKGAHGVEYFSYATERDKKKETQHFLAIPNYYGGVTSIYVFNAPLQQFVQFVNIPSEGAGQVEATEINKVLYVIIAENFANVLTIYRYNDVKTEFIKHQQLKLNGVSSMAIVTCRNKTMLVGASYFSDNSFVTTSMVYLWDNTLNLFSGYYSFSGTEGPHDVEAIHNDKICGFFLSNDRNAKEGESTFIKSQLFTNSDAGFENILGIATDGAHGAEFFQTHNGKNGMLAIANFGNRYQKRYHSASIICKFPITDVNYCQEVQTYGATDFEHFQLDIGNGFIVDYLIVSNEGDIGKGKYQLSTLYRVLT